MDTKIEKIDYIFDIMKKLYSLKSDYDRLNEEFYNSFNEYYNNEKIVQDYFKYFDVYGYYYKNKNINYNYYFTIHIDTIKVPEFEFKKSDKTISGQLDNYICLSIFYSVLKNIDNYEYMPDFLLTTKEENGISWILLNYINKTYNKIPISLDIDISFNGNLNGITIPYKDNAGVFDVNIVNKFRDIANKNNILINENCWTIVETGFYNKNTALKCCHIGLPIINYHSNNEIVLVDSVLSYYKFLEILVKNLKEI